MYSLVTSLIGGAWVRLQERRHQGSSWAFESRKVVRGGGVDSLKDTGISVRLLSQVWQVWLPEAKMSFQEGKEEQLRTNAGFHSTLTSLLVGKSKMLEKDTKNQFGQISLVSLV